MDPKKHDIKCGLSTIEEMNREIQVLKAHVLAIEKHLDFVTDSPKEDPEKEPAPLYPNVKRKPGRPRKDTP